MRDVTTHLHWIDRLIFTAIAAALMLNARLSYQHLVEGKATEVAVVPAGDVEIPGPSQTAECLGGPMTELELTERFGEVVPQRKAPRAPTREESLAWIAEYAATGVIPNRPVRIGLFTYNKRPPVWVMNNLDAILFSHPADAEQPLNVERKHPIRPNDRIADQPFVPTGMGEAMATVAEQSFSGPRVQFFPIRTHLVDPANNLK